MPVTSKPLRPITLSRLLTTATVSATYRDMSAALTVETAYYRLSVTPLPHDKLDMRVGACDGLEVIVEECAEVGRGYPIVAVLEDHLPDLRDESAMAVSGKRALLCAEKRSKGRGKLGGHGG